MIYLGRFRAQVAIGRDAYYALRILIKSFSSDDAQRLFNDERVLRFVNFERAARRKLLALGAATQLNELARVPGNRLESLKGDRKGQHSIRINDQWRICFRWSGSDAENVEIVDYH
jgi:toxin HigB-1